MLSVKVSGSDLLRYMRKYEPQNKLRSSVWMRIKEYARKPNLVAEVYPYTIRVPDPNCTNGRYDFLDMVLSPESKDALKEFSTFVYNKEMLKYSDSTNVKIEAIGACGCGNASTSASTAASALNAVADLCNTYAVPAWETWSTIADKTSNSPTIEFTHEDWSALKKIADKYNAPVKCDEVKENKNMFNFDFGKITSNDVRFSTYGLAVRSVDGRYVAYDSKNKSVMDVDVLNMPAGDFLYKMPVALKDIKVGDIVIHNRVPMFVLDKTMTDLTVIDIRESTKKTIMPVKSPFGFNFITKVVSLVDMGGANADTPFGNMLPFLMMSDNGKIEDIMPLMMMTGGMKMDASNPMLMYFLMKDGKMDKMTLPLMMMMNQSAPTPAPVCECGQPAVVATPC